jgi:hypothetical protein
LGTLLLKRMGQSATAVESDIRAEAQFNVQGSTHYLAEHFMLYSRLCARPGFSRFSCPHSCSLLSFLRVQFGMLLKLCVYLCAKNSTPAHNFAWRECGFKRLTLLAVELSRSNTHSVFPDSLQLPVWQPARPPARSFPRF